MKNLIVILIGIVFLVSGITYFQATRANRQCAEQWRQVEEKLKAVEAQVTTLQNTVQMLTAAAPEPSDQQQPLGAAQPGSIANPAPETSPPAATQPTEPNAANQSLPSEVLARQVSEHAGLIKARVERAWRIPQGAPANLACMLRIELLPGGEVHNVSVAQSSGNSSFDESALAAVKRASPFPMPANADVAARFRKFNFRFSPAS